MKVEKERNRMTGEEKYVMKILSCNNCKFATCEQCEISYIDKKKILNLLDKKNKIISAMVDMIDEYSEYYARYGNTIEFCDEDCINNDKKIDCKNCIKQYFENEVRGNIDEGNKV